MGEWGKGQSPRIALRKDSAIHPPHSADLSKQPKRRPFHIYFFYQPTFLAVDSRSNGPRRILPHTDLVGTVYHSRKSLYLIKSIKSFVSSPDGQTKVEGKNVPEQVRTFVGDGRKQGLPTSSSQGLQKHVAAVTRRSKMRIAVSVSNCEVACTFARMKGDQFARPSWA